MCIKMLDIISRGWCMAFAMSMTFYMVYASDPSPLQDFCVGVNDTNLSVSVNGLFCKNPRNVTSNDFLFQGFNTVGNTTNPFGSQPSMVNVTRFPALNTLGISMGRVDYAPGGLNPPHYHPRGSEMFTVIEGTLFVGFITSNLPNGINRLYSTILKKGDLFVIPQSLIHFQLNIGDTPAVTNAAFGSQNPGRIAVSGAVFGSSIPDIVLRRAFQVNESVIQALRSQFVSDDDDEKLEFDLDFDDQDYQIGLSSLA